MYISDYDKGVIRQVVEKQLEAFQKEDAETAFNLASPAIQKQFGTPANFMQMVKTGYPSVYRPRSIMFRGFTTIDRYPAQVLIVMDEGGNLSQAIYVMQQQQDFSWRIHGCFMVPLDRQVI
jgi:Domain of unknown function (DUF4864)